MNKRRKIGFQRLFYLNTSLILATIIIGTISSLAQGKPPAKEAQVTLPQPSLTRKPASPSPENAPSSQEDEATTEAEAEPLDFSDTGRPGQQTAGETRQRTCPEVSFPLTALVPSSNTGKTIAARPTLWFYVPYSVKDVNKIEFVIQDAKRRDISRQTWQPQNIPGYLSVSFPETEPPLTTNKSYRWYFKIYCQDNGDSAPIFVQGWIDKVAPTADLLWQVQLEQSPHMIYAQQELWFDAINSLLHYYVIAPDNGRIEKDWEKLITAQGVNLELPEPKTTNLFVKQD